MLRVRYLLAFKHKSVWTIGPEEPVLEAIQVMADKHIGALPVMRDDELVGIVSERDYARKVILLGRSSAETPVWQIMTSDVVTVHLLLSKRTRGLIGADDLGRMKPTALLINTSRGPIVEQQALLDALREGRIGGAGLDVFDQEPLPLDHPLRTAPRTVLTPHLGYVTRNTYEIFYREAVEDVAAFLAGSPLRVVGVTS